MHRFIYWYKSIFPFLTPLLIIAVVGIFVALSGDVNDLRARLTSTQNKLSETSQTLNEIIQGNEDLEARLSEETRKRVLAQQSEEEARDQFEGKIVELQTGLKEQKDVFDASDISKLISEWSPRVVRLECSFEDENGNGSKGRGSAVATYLGSVPHFLTNKHVIEDDDPLVNCKSTFLSGEQVLAGQESITISDKVDVGYIRAEQASFVGIDTPVRTCSEKPAIGDAVVILGYPSVGGSGITATEGIVSGFDEEYYITSAKIEQGNSGGAAVHVKDNCFLGMPTLVLAGRVESLARILPI